MEEKKKVPAVRFKGFTGDWERRKLGDFTERVTRKNENLESNLPLTISAQYGLIDQNQFFDKRIASKDVSGYYLIRNGEFAYNKSTSKDAPWGAIKRLDRYKAGVLSTLYIVFKINESQNMDSDFLVSYYETDLWHKEVQGIAAEGARNHGLLNVAPGDFFKTKLRVPADIEEQKKLGRYFKDVDHLLTLNQQKLDQLKKLKAYFLQNLFPAKGEKVPKSRFKGFTDDWEQRKLGEITKVNSFKRYIAEGTLDGTYEVIQQGDTPVVGYADGKPFEDYEDVSLFGDHTLSLYKPKSPFFVASDGIKILSPSISINGLFYYYLLMRYKPHSEGYKRHYTILKSCEALYPTECEEQKKIGEYFANLDNLITLHQRKLEALQTLKKYLLQNLFI